MTDLLVHPSGTSGKVHEVSPASAGWSYVGFDLWRMTPGMVAQEETGDGEAILVLVEGKARITADGRDMGELGDRMDVFEGTPPHAVYVPSSSHWRVEATTDATLAVCTAPGRRGHAAQIIGPAGIVRETRGVGGNTRYINAIAMEDRDVADSLLVTEVFTPQGNWSSYPPHRHDEDDWPRITYLEETYYHRLSPPTGYGHQRVFTDNGDLDETMTVRDHDVVLVPRGHHPCATPWGVEMYYLNVMAGPRRNWRFEVHPDFAWIAARDTPPG